MIEEMTPGATPGLAGPTDEEAARWMRALAREGSTLRLDSREIRPGDIFCAVPGARSDGRSFIRVAAARGAAGVIYEAREDRARDPEHHSLPALAVPGLSRRLGSIASRFLGDPSARMAGVAVTGTNGKTTTTFWTAALLDGLSEPCAVIGTVGAFLKGERIPGPHLTTPDAPSLEHIYAEALSRGAKAFAVEASSVGLEQGRLAGSHFRAGVFTNLTRDHLDYHGTMEAYARAKGLLFAWPGLGAAILNADDPLSESFAGIAAAHGAPVWAIGLEGAARRFAQRHGAAHWLDAVNAEPTGRGMRFTIDLDGARRSAEIPAIGLFNVENALCALGAVLSLGHGLDEALPLLARLAPPPGRMQLVHAEGLPLGVVDFCHTPDALAKAVESLLPSARARGGRLWTVFGCGGDRDPGKRPMMGAIAAKLSDLVVITSDNPRSEDPEAIVAAVAAGCPDAANVMRVVDRREAIHRSVLEAAPEDVILVAGKGHESEQILADGAHPFLDAEVLREAFNERRTRGSRKA